MNINKNFLLFLFELLFSFILCSCCDYKNYEGGCLYTDEYIIDINNGKKYTIMKDISEIILKYNCRFNIKDNNIIYGCGYYNATFVEYSIKDKKYLKKIVLGNEGDEIVFSGYNENEHLIYYIKKGLLISYDVEDNIQKDIMDLKKYINNNHEKIIDFYFDSLNQKLFIKFEREIYDELYEKYNNIIILINLLTMEKKTICTSQDNKQIGMYYNYFYNIFLYANDEDLIEINNDKIRKLKIKAKTMYNPSELSIDYIDKDTILYRIAKISFKNFIAKGSEEISINVYDIKKNKIYKIFDNNDSYQPEKICYLRDKAIFELLIGIPLSDYVGYQNSIQPIRDRLD
ncbi:MAG: hypothetical protein JXB88_13435 [Spirochaetales bacterium]|nr:hypothetical protein [Spirochaetales bacterium]